MLSDGEKRARYDRFGHDGAGGPAAEFPDGGFGDFGDLFNDLFGDLFGAAARRRRASRRGQRGADLRYDLEIDLVDVLEGKEASLDLPKMMACEECTGSGAKAGTQPETCGRCGGSGQAIFQQGLFRISRPCDACRGQGSVVRDPCPACRGAGRTEGRRKIQVFVPAGVEDGMRLRVSGEGEAGLSGGPPGDLYVVIRLRQHQFFERNGGDLLCEVPVPFVHAALGAEVEVPTLEGKVNLRIPEGTQNGRVLRLRGKGLPTLRTAQRGDQLVQIFVEVPTKLTDKQRALLEEFAEESGTEVSPVTRGFIEKLRDLFD